MDPLLIYYANEGKKYLFNETEFNKENIIKFMKDVEGEQLPVYYQNQELPENNTGPVIVYNAKVFKEEIINSEKEYVIKFYAPWCMHCMDLAPEF